MTNSDDWNDFLDRLPGSPNDTTIAARAVVSPSTVSRWRAGATHPRPMQAVDVAEAFGLLSIHGLLAAGYITTELIDKLSEGFTLPKSYALDSFSTAELSAEVAKRVARGDY